MKKLFLTHSHFKMNIVSIGVLVLVFCLASTIQAKTLNTLNTLNTLSTINNTSLVQEQKLKLTKGKVEILEGFSPDKIAVGDGNIIEVKALDNQQLLIIAKAVGLTSLRVWDLNGNETNYQIIVAKPQIDVDITMRQVIRMKVKMIEFRKSSLKEIGVDWLTSTQGPEFGIAQNIINSQSQPLISGMMTNTSGLPLYLGIQSTLKSTLHFMEQSGDATLLAEPTLSCLSGESASFIAGGEVPFPTTDENGRSTVSFKNYGIMLEVKPFADKKGRIYTSISTEVSNVDFSVAVNGAPGFLTRRTDTHMNVISGQTIVISGLLSQNSSNDMQAIPGLHKIPILGQLFQSNRYQRNQTQLVVLVTPYIENPETQWGNRDNLQSQHIQGQQLSTVLDQGLSEIDINFSD